MGTGVEFSRLLLRNLTVTLWEKEDNAHFIGEEMRLKLKGFTWRSPGSPNALSP